MAHILIIEDDELLRKVLASTLTDAGHSVYQAGEGRQGCELVSTLPTNLVLTDLIMPEQEGIETIIEIRERHPNLPIIAMSGAAHHGKFYRDVALKLGARRVLAKPFTAQELLHAITEALGGTASGNPAPS